MQIYDDDDDTGYVVTWETLPGLLRRPKGDLILKKRRP